MAFRFILLVLPALAVASIEVEILGKYNGDANDLKVHYKGDDNSIISETETTTFNVINDRIKNFVPAYFREHPNIVGSERKWTPRADFEKTYTWNEVNRTLVPRSGKIIKNSVTQTVVAYHTFENNSTIPISFNVDLSRSVVNRVMSSWRTSGKLSGIEINYGIRIKRANNSGEHSFSYTSSWGQNMTRSQNVIVGTSSNIDITIQPGEGVVARLKATKLLVKLKMVYDASLSGKVAVHYYDWKGYFYYLVPINYCMRRARISNRKTSWEFIDIEFFSDSKVVVSDLRHGHVLLEVQ